MAILPPILEDLDFIISSKVSSRQMDLANKTIRSLMQENLKSGGHCSVADIRDAFLANETGAHIKNYLINDFIEEMDVEIKGVKFHVSIPLFPKRAESESVRFEIPKERISRHFKAETDPDSVVELLTAIASWMPEYYKVEDTIREEEKKKRIACDLAMDLLKRSIGGKLEEKRYTFFARHSYVNHRGTLEIDGGKGLRMIMHVDLLEDFLEDMTRIVDSLPPRYDI